MLEYFRGALAEINDVISLIEGIGVTGVEDLDIFLQELLDLLYGVKATIENAIQSLEAATATTTSSPIGNTETGTGATGTGGTGPVTGATGPTAGPTGTFAPGPTAGPTGTFAPEPVYCCGSWGSYQTEDDQNAGKATYALSVIACTNYTDGVEIALRLSAQADSVNCSADSQATPLH